MSKQSREVFEQIKSGEQPGVAEAIKEVGGRIWDAGKDMFDHGRTELAAALFAGHAHVMYMHNGPEVDQPSQGMAQNQPEPEQDMGREM